MREGFRGYYRHYARTIRIMKNLARETVRGSILTPFFS
jgi:hypothetical protein